MNAVSAPIANLSSDTRRWASLIVVCMAQLMIVLDVTIVNVALPSIQHDLHFSQAGLTWVVNAFLVLIWALTGAGYFWPIWVIGGWGIGLVLHAWTAFLQKPITEADIDREVERGGSAI